MSDYVIEAEGLVKRYGKHTALDGVDLHARPGTVLGVLGPNGAGKTTAIRILATLTGLDAGTAKIGGMDVTRDAAKVRRIIGLTGQYATLDEELTGVGNLILIGRLLDLRKPEANRRADALLDRFGLTEAAGKPVATYSGGMRRRLDLAASLVSNPRVVFLDEPSVGLDPGKREELWRRMRQDPDHPGWSPRTRPPAPPLAVHPLGALVQPAHPRRGSHRSQPLPTLECQPGLLPTDRAGRDRTAHGRHAHRAQPRQPPRVAHHADDPSPGRSSSVSPSTTETSTRPPGPAVVANANATGRFSPSPSPSTEAAPACPETDQRQPNRPHGIRNQSLGSRRRGPRASPTTELPVRVALTGSFVHLFRLIR